MASKGGTVTGRPRWTWARIASTVDAIIDWCSRSLKSEVTGGRAEKDLLTASAAKLTFSSPPSTARSAPWTKFAGACKICDIYPSTKQREGVGWQEKTFGKRTCQQLYWNGASPPRSSSTVTKQWKPNFAPPYPTELFREIASVISRRLTAWTMPMEDAVA